MPIHAIFLELLAEVWHAYSNAQTIISAYSCLPVSLPCSAVDCLHRLTGGDWSHHIVSLARDAGRGCCMGAGRSDLMDKLEMRADSAKAFEAKAAPCLAAVAAAAMGPAAAAATQAGDNTAAEDTSTSVVDAAASTAAAAAADTGGAVSAPLSVQPAKLTLAELESLVQEGQAIGIKLDSLTDLSRLLHSAQAWSQQVEHCLTGKEPHVGSTRGITQGRRWKKSTA